MAQNIVEGVVAETVELVHLALVDGVVAVDIEQIGRHCGNLVHIVAVESNDTHADKVGNILGRSVFRALELELACKAALGFHAAFGGGDHETLVRNILADDIQNHLLETLQHRDHLAIFLEDQAAMQVQTVILAHPWMSKRL